MSTLDRQLARLLLETCRFTYSAVYDSASEKDDLADANAAIESVAPIRAHQVLPLDPKASTSVAHVFRFDDFCVVSYMGTRTNASSAAEAIHSVADWAQNFRAVPRPFLVARGALSPNDTGATLLPGIVHEGFLSEFNRIQPQVLAYLDLHCNGLKIYVTGHSQGGAVAALATLALLKAGRNVAATYTFASPRPGNQALADSLPPSQIFHRLEFGDDIVPHVPPRLMPPAVKDFILHCATMPFTSQQLRNFLTNLGSSPDNMAFAGLGRLSYADTREQVLHAELPESQEAELFPVRVKNLLFHVGNWAEHHHLAGTTAETHNGQKGNYTAMISSYPLA